MFTGVYIQCRQIYSYNGNIEMGLNSTQLPKCVISHRGLGPKFPNVEETSTSVVGDKHQAAQDVTG